MLPARSHKLGARRGQQGFSLIELMFAAVLTAVAAVGLTYLTIDAINSRRNAGIASDAARVANAANSFISANYTAIAGSPFPYTITLAQLQSPTDYLNGSFSTTNNYGQGYTIRVLKTAQGGLEAMVVTTGGSAIPDGYLSEIAGNMVEQKAAGGAIASTDGTVAKGYQGGWTRDVTAYGLNPGAGHLAVFLAYSNASVVDDALHRTAHPENTALNTMSTALQMSGNAIGGVSDVKTNAANQGITFFGGGERIVGTADFGISFQSGGGVERMRLYNDGHLGMPGGNALSVGGSWFYGDATNMALRPGANGGTVYVQGTAAANGAAHLYVAGNATAAGDVTANGSAWASNWFRSNGQTGWINQTYNVGVFASDTSWVRATTNFYSPGQIQGGSLQSNSTIVAAGRITSNEFVVPRGGAGPNTGCDQNGAIGQLWDGSGSLMNCVNGVWRQVVRPSGQWYNVANYINQNYAGHNFTDHDMFVNAISNGTACGTLNNDYSAIAIVNGAMVASNVENNVDYYKQHTMSFFVPAGTDYQITWSRYKCNTQTVVWEYR